MWDAPEALFSVDVLRREIRPSANWGSIWARVRELGPSLVIIDPVSAALEAPNMNDSGPVRGFMRALAREAKEAGCGVLLVAHDTKASREGQSSPGAGAISGSATWHDAARGVLYMQRREGTQERLITCIKASYGSAWWEIGLRENFNSQRGGAFAGFALLPNVGSRAQGTRS